MKSITNYFQLLPITAVLLMGILSCNEKDIIKEDEKQSGCEIVTLSAVKGPFMIASLSGQMSGLDGVDHDYECGIEYSTDETFSDEYSIRQKVDKIYTDDLFSITVLGIQPGKKYYFRAYCIHQLQIYFGEVKTFIFEWTAPDVTTLSADLFDVGTVILKGLVKDKGNIVKDLSDYYPYGYYGIEISTTETFDVNTTTIFYPDSITDNMENDSVICSMIQFKYDSTYYYRTFFRLGAIESFGQVKSFKFELTAPYVTTLSAELNELGIVILKGLVKDKGTIVNIVKDLSDYYPYGYYGIELSTTESFDVSSTTILYPDSITDNMYNDSVICTMPQFNFGSTYYYRTFFRYGTIEGFGQVESFKFEWNGPNMVDLGLSVKWATCNVGATYPWDYGEYFAWGETEPKINYSWSTYKYCDGRSDNLTKYNNNSSWGTVDNKTILNSEDDAAYVILGGNWRMPTLDEFVELYNSNNCTWTWTTQNDVNGYLVTSMKTGYEGNSSQMCIRDSRGDTVSDNDGSEGFYWSSSLAPSSTFDAWDLHFDSWSSYPDYYYGNRNFGFTVRPVCP